jgi:probable F420-dependent oxidoreductase
LRPFRFIAPMPSLQASGSGWRAGLEQIEDMGFSTVRAVDHLCQDRGPDALTVLAGAATTTRSLRLLTCVLANDFRHPVITQKAAATIDAMSDGRLELGLGAGWLAQDYEALGLQRDLDDVRVERLGEAVRIIKGLFVDEPYSFSGRYYTIHDLRDQPLGIQRPHPPFLIGGGGRKILSLAAREADIISVNARLGPYDELSSLLIDTTAERLEKKLGWIATAALEAGRDPSSLEYQLDISLFRLVRSHADSSSYLQAIASRGCDPSMLETHPGVLVGPLAYCVDRLQALRELLGFSYIYLGTSLGSDARAAAPLVARLSGR